MLALFSIVSPYLMAEYFNFFLKSSIPIIGLVKDRQRLAIRDLGTFRICSGNIA